MSLNKKQHEVATTTSHTIVCAPPGSGKTHTTIELAANILQLVKKRLPDDKSSPVDNETRLAMVTFTRNGADEITERLEERLTKKSLKRVRANTFHSFMIALYKRSKSKNRIIMGGPQHNIIRMAINEIHPHLSEFFMDVVQSIDKLGRAISEDTSSVSDEHKAVYKHYVHLCERYSKIDLNHMSKEVLRLLNEGVIEPFKVDYLVIDEYQDTDEIQWLWTKIHGDAGVKIITVGDDDQSIYSFRGALGFKGMQLLEQNFGACAKVLEICYRSHEEILMAAKSLIENNTYRMEKRMIANKGKGGTVTIVDSRHAEGEISHIEEILAKKAGSWAILARNRQHLDAVESMVKDNGYSYKRLDGKNIFDAPEVQGCLKIVGMLERNNSIHAVVDMMMFLEEEEADIYIVKQCLTPSNKGFEYLNEIDFHQCSTELSSLSYWWSSALKNTNDETEIKKRVNKLKHIITRAKGVDQKSGKIYFIFFDMLESWALKKGWKETVILCNKLLRNKRQEDEKVYDVVLGTKHSSKGLEWDNVWVMSLNDSVCPGEAVTLEEIEEERRILFVAMTRAKNNLYLSYHGEQKKSYFLTEISTDFAKHEKWEIK